MTVELYTREPTYIVKTFDLGVARTNELITFNGQLVIVKEITGNATIKFNNVVNDEIPLTEMRGKTSITYNRFYITNVSQPGKILRLLAGRDMDFESGNDVSIIDTQENRINPATRENQILVDAQNHGQIDVLSSALPVGAATEATLETILKTSDLNISASKNIQVDVLSTVLPHDGVRESFIYNLFTSVSNYNSSIATPLTVILTANGRPNLEVWVKSSAATVFNVLGSFDNVNWRKFDELTLTAIGELHKKYTNAYNFIKVETTALNDNEIEIVAGR